MPTPSARRVADHTAPAAAERIARQAEISLAYFARHPEQIGRRLRGLDAEWDVERALEAGSSALTLTGLLLALARGRRWLLLPLAVQGYFMHHALDGWWPPLPVLRRLGFRIQYEIERERYALKAIRGDFRQTGDAHEAFAATGA